MNNQKPVSVVFVCMGNICRSPTAEGVFRHVVEHNGLADVISIDSAGTHAYHIGESPDSRSQSTAKNHGIDLSSQRARKVQNDDFSCFDYIIAMDRANYENLIRLKNTSINTKQKANLHLFMEFTANWENDEIPDPYYDKREGFETVFKMIQAASEGLLEHIISNNKLKNHTIS